MPRSEYFTAASLRIEAQRQDHGWHYYAWRPGTSQAFLDSVSLLRWAKWPTKTPTGDALRQWLAELDDSTTPPPEPVPHAAAPGSFDPLAHLDESDPNHQTRTVI